MFFTYTDEQIELIEAASEAAKIFLEPTVKEDDEQENFRPELLQQLGEAGMCGIPISEEFEGYEIGISHHPPLKLKILLQRNH